MRPKYTYSYFSGLHDILGHRNTAVQNDTPCIHEQPIFDGNRTRLCLYNKEHLIKFLFVIFVEYFGIYWENRHFLFLPDKMHYFIHYKFRIFCQNFIFENNVKRHFCNVKNLWHQHDLPKSVNERVILSFCEGFIFINFASTKIKPSQKFWIIQLYLEITCFKYLNLYFICYFLIIVLFSIFRQYWNIWRKIYVKLWTLLKTLFIYSFPLYFQIYSISKASKDVIMDRVMSMVIIFNVHNCKWNCSCKIFRWLSQ